ncbi:MAG: DUF4838 domain-containing protein [Armatimonadota bacterium]|jgi:hypothetical protein
MKLVLTAENTPAASVVIEPDSPPAVSFAARELSRYLAILTGGRFPVCEEDEGAQGGVFLRTATTPHPPGPLPASAGLGDADGASLAGEGGERRTAWRGTGPRPTNGMGGQGSPPLLDGMGGEGSPPLFDGMGGQGSPPLFDGMGGQGSPPLLKRVGGRGAYAWRIDERGVEIVAQRPGAVLHAVYALLETLGCRWLHPRDGGEIIPRTPTVELPHGEHVAEPAMTIRELTNLHAIDREYPLHIDWMAKNRMNRFMAFLNVEGSLDAFTDLESELAIRDMDATLGHHSFRFLLPPDAHFAEHPEWYALIDGERSPDGQLCTSTPEVVERVAERICALFDAHPTVEMFGLWPNDGFGWCECERCTTIEEPRPSQFRPEHPRRTDTYLRFVNAVAELVEESHPGRRLSALAYVNYADAPERTRPAENVAVCFAPFLRCLKHPLRPDVGCDRMNAAYAGEFVRWREVTPGDLYVFSYLSQIHTLSLPFPIHEMIAENQRWLIDAGCDGFTMEFVPEEWGAFGANIHEIARLAWEPGMDVEAWLAAHDEAICGPAAERIGRWRSESAQVLMEAGPCTGHYDLTWTTRATERTLRPALEALGRARALAATGEKRHWQAVEQAWVGQELLLLVGQWQRLLRDAKEAPEVRRESLRRRAEAARSSALAFAREQADSGAVDPRRYERVLGQA